MNTCFLVFLIGVTFVFFSLCTTTNGVLVIAPVTAPVKLMVAEPPETVIDTSSKFIGTLLASAP